MACLINDKKKLLLLDEHFIVLNVCKERDDHYFFLKPKSHGSQAYNEIMKQWIVLRDSLPSSIYVVAYSNRLDLLRAMIVGGDGTPYHDGLFFFDIQFPCHFPQKPPLVIFRSYGYKINPKIGSDGTVHLSLLNSATCMGMKSSVRWDPHRSTVLEVLVSIQGLLSNPKPYFEGPWWRRSHSPTWERRSDSYNEAVFVRSCELMIFSISSKPRGFKHLVERHFRARGRAILASCGAHASGRVGIATSASGAGIADVSEDFREVMDVVYKRLVVHFKVLGVSVSADVSELFYVMRSEMELLTGVKVDDQGQSQSQSQAKERGVLEKAFEGFRESLGLMRKNRLVSDNMRRATKDMF